MNNLFDLTGKTAVVTGGYGLIGSEIAKALAFYGSKVFAADVVTPFAEEQQEKSTNNILFLPMDITDESSIGKGIESVLSKSNSIDIWVNTAYPRTPDWGKKLEEIPFESWRKNIDMHLNGYYCCNKLIAQQMKMQSYGSVINFASIYGMLGPDFSIYEGTDMTMPAAYSVIKSAIINLTRYLASYYGSNGVRFNCISPGGVWNHQPETFVKRYSEKVPLGRMAKKTDISGAVIYLASDASAYVTGHNLIIDGGWTCI